jgi:hypothetical protein
MPIYKKVNKKFFFKWSANMAYILGFLYADGNILRNKRGAHFISFYSTDFSLIKQIRKVLDSEHKISLRRGEGKNYCLQIGSKQMYQNLQDLGLKENKTSRMRIPKIPQKYFGDFLRGYFDGDGNVWVGLTHKERKTSHKVIKTTFTSCSKDFLEDLRKIIYKISTSSGFLVKGRGNYYRLIFSIKGSFNLYKIMYNGTQSSLYLKRKKIRFAKYFENK